MKLFLFQLVIYSTLFIALKLSDRKHKREMKKIIDEFNEKYESERLDRDI